MTHEDQRMTECPGTDQRELEDAVSISIVVPMYNESEVIDSFFSTIIPVCESVTDKYEIVCVNDGSKDDTLQRLKSIRESHPFVKIIDLSRNFGKELALTAGLDHTSGAAVIPIDADLQDPPELIPQMIEKWREGFDVVLAVREDREADTVTKRVTANAFYVLMQHLGEVPLPRNAGDFRVMDRRVVDALRTLPERTRFMKGMFAWLGFTHCEVKYKRQARVAGDSKWPYWRLWNFALDGVTSFTTLPLRIWTYLGVAISLVATVYLFFIVGRTLFFGIDVPGYASNLSVLLFFGGLNLIGLGIIGEYLGRVYVEVKLRPLYIVRSALGFKSGFRRTTAPLSE